MSDTRAPIGRLLDRWLENLDPQAKAGLHRCAAGKTIRLLSVGRSFDCLIVIDEHHLNLRPATEQDDPDLVIEFRLSLLSAPMVGLSLEQLREMRWLTIRGDVQFAHQLHEIYRDKLTNVDDEARVFSGASVAAIAGRSMVQLYQILTQAKRNLRLDTVDWLLYQHGALIDRASFIDLDDQVRHLSRELNELRRRMDSKRS